MNKINTLLIGALFCTTAFAQTKPTATLPPALTAIKEADLKKDIFELAGDAMRGRRAGTTDEFRQPPG